MSLKVCFLDEKSHHQLGNCEKCKLSVLIQGVLNQKLGVAPSNLYFNKHLECLLKYRFHWSLLTTGLALPPHFINKKMETQSRWGSHSLFASDPNTEYHMYSGYWNNCWFNYWCFYRLEGLCLFNQIYWLSAKQT